MSNSSASSSSTGGAPSFPSEAKRKRPEEADLVESRPSSASSAAAKQEQQAAAKRRRPFNFSIESLMQSASSGHSEPLELAESAPSSPAGSAGSPADSLVLAERPGSSLSSCSSAGDSSLASAQPEVECASAAGSCAPADGSPSHSAAGGAGTPRGATNQLLRPPVCRDARLAPFQCHLDNLDLWHRFHPLDTEMIITKQGRRMFPPVKVTFSLDSSVGAAQPPLPAGGPSARDKFQVLMDILPYDSKRYRYAYHKSSWQQAGKADPPSPAKLFLHPDGPFTLDQLKRQVISFEKIKLTNNDANKHGYIVLNSMHKYQPRIHLVLWRGKDSSQQSLANAPISQLDGEIYKTFIFSETIFTAVTAYQNHSITKLKIDSNPFAKGFRDSTRITDLELETINDLMSDGQCPFSPPRAPPHGFPHFLFAAAAAQQQQQMGGALPAPQMQPQQQQSQPMEDPASALLRERTIMALDSFLQQQQQQQQQQQATASPHMGPSTGTPSSSAGASGSASRLQASHTPRAPANNQASNPQLKSPQPPLPLLYPGGPPIPPPPYSSAAPTATSSAPAFFGLHSAGPPGGQSLEQLLMQQHQFAAAVAAAAHQHQSAYQQQYYPQLAPHLQSLFGLAPGAQAGPPAPHLAGARQRSSPALVGKQAASSPSGQLSPIGAAKLAAEFTGAGLLAAPPPGGATGAGSHYQLSKRIQQRQVEDKL